MTAYTACTIITWGNLRGFLPIEMIEKIFERTALLKDQGRTDDVPEYIDDDNNKILRKWADRATAEEWLEYMDQLFTEYGLAKVPMEIVDL